jgi:hypothetical protein
LLNWSFKGRVGELLTSRLAKSGSRRLSDSPNFHLNIQKPTFRLGESGSRLLPDSPSRRVSDSPTRLVGDSPTPRLAESGSRFSITNISANSKPISAKTPENPPHCHVPLCRRTVNCNVHSETYTVTIPSQSSRFHQLTHTH